MRMFVSYLVVATQHLRRNEVPPPAVAKWLSEGLQTFLSKPNRSLEDVLGLRNPRGGMPWWKEEATRVRDQALRDIAATLGTHQPCPVREVKRLLDQYSRRWQRRDSALEEMPQDYRGTINELLWKAFHSQAQLPLGERQLRNILPANTNTPRVRSERP